MVKAKHLMDPVEPDDGPRVWVEPIGLTQDWRKWCSVDELLLEIAPPRELWEWFVAHPQDYENFRSRYHAWLSRSPHLPVLEQLSCGALLGNFTLLHAGDADHNCAAALMEYITELEVSYATGL